MKNKVSSGGDLMFKVSEATLPKAMDYVYENFIKPHDPEGLLAYRPTGSQSGLSSWQRDNPTTGIIYLAKHPQAKVAWVLVKFEQNKNKTYGQHVIYNDNVKITSKEQFKEFFGVEPTIEFPEDMTIYVRWNKEKRTNNNPNRDFDQYAPNFYMYTNHLSANLDVVIQRLYRINEIIETNPKAIVGDQFNIPYSATNTKL